MRFAAAVSLLTCLSTVGSVAADDKPAVVELWPGKVPDETGNIGAEYVRMSPKLDRKQVEVTESTRMVTNVTKPTITVYRPAKATWYGPGFFGKRTACGKKLNRATTGVAHRTLACGTEVAIRYAGRSIVVPVIDRGPFSRGVSWDLTYATAKKLGMKVTSRVGVAPIMLPLTAPAL